jgi:hypothetical protein
MNNEVSSMRSSISMLAAAVLLGVGLVPAADALTVSVVPQASTVAAGGTVSVDVVADMEGDSALSLGSYDVQLSFGSTVLSFANLVFGTGLGVTGMPSIPQEFDVGAGTVSAFESSLETTADLNALQPNAFTLFTVTFNALQAGTSALSLVVNSLGNAAGTQSLTAQVLNSSVTVTGAPAVPLPAGVWLLMSGLAGVASFVRRSPQSPGG